jgi:hypothetical protein
VSAAEAALATANLNLGFTEVRSLVSGVAGQATTQVGTRHHWTLVSAICRYNRDLCSHFGIQCADTQSCTCGPLGLPSRLLERRPDILQAKQQLIEANARIGVARAQFFPQLSLTAAGGVGGSDFSTIFDPDSRLIYGIGALTQPIFEGGKLRGQLQLSEETKKEMVLNYQKTIAGAFRDASDTFDCPQETAFRP